MKRLFPLLALATAFAIVPTAIADTIPVGTISEDEAPGMDVWASGTFVTLHPGNTPNSVGTGGLSFVTYETSVSDTDLVFSPGTAAEGDVFTFNDGLTFTITGPVTVVSDTGDFLNIIATSSGVFTLAGYSPTAGSFSFTGTDVSGYAGATDPTTGLSSSAAGETFTSTGVVSNYSSVPEPSSLVLLGTGLLGMAFGLFRRSRTACPGSVA